LAALFQSRQAMPLGVRIIDADLDPTDEARGRQIAHRATAGPRGGRGLPKNDYGHFLVLIPMRGIWQDGFDAGVEPSADLAERLERVAYYYYSHVAAL